MIEAITRNPRPLIMVLIGLVGMPLTLWLSSPAPARQQVERDPVILVSEPIPAEILFTGPVAPDPALTVDTIPEALTPAGIVPHADVHFIAIIIDDIGYLDSLGARAVALPDDVTFAVLPHTPFGTVLAEAAHSNGKEVMLHAPMSNLANMPLGPGGLTPSLSKEEFVSTLTQAIDAIPHLRGINNHMGSELTAQENQMQWVMETLKQRNLYFVDSYTTAQSVAGRIAREQEIPTLTRNVFLDNVQTYEDIDREFQRLLQVARENGSAVGIGHPYEATLDYLEKAIPTLAQLNIELIPVSAMIMLQQGATDAL